MRALGRAMKAARSSMMAQTMDAVADDVRKHFGLSDGDYVEFDRIFERTDGPKHLRTRGRITHCEQCYVNARGGYTALVKVAPLLVSGSLGNTRSVWICINADGTGLRGVRGYFGRVRDRSSEHSHA